MEAAKRSRSAVVDWPDTMLPKDADDPRGYITDLAAGFDM